jgi:histidyl-tRNA synthetase
LPALRGYYSQTSALIPEDAVNRLMALLEIKGDNRTVLTSLRELLNGYAEAVEGITELEEMLRYLDLLGVPEQYCAVEVSMVRGLEYYTGPIYETIVEEGGVGSVTGGGRYDKLVGMFGDRNLPATGTTIGIERIIVVMEDQGMFPSTVGKTVAQVLVTAFDRARVDESVKLAALLRQAGLRVQVYFDPDPLREQIGYAVTKGIPLLVIVGPDEIAQGRLTVRDLRTKRQETVVREQAAEVIKSWLG